MDYIISRFIWFLALMPALTLHEFAHAYAAVRAGDPTPKMAGRVTLNPLAHLDPIGTLAILFLPIGWARPVPVNPMNFRRPRRDDIVVSAVGPLSNIAQAVFWGVVLRVLVAVAPEAAFGTAGTFLFIMVMLNLILAGFNLVPLGPLDGHHIMQNLLPYPHSERYRMFNRQYGMIALFGALILLSYTGFFESVVGGLQSVLIGLLFRL